MLRNATHSYEGCTLMKASQQIHSSFSLIKNWLDSDIKGKDLQQFALFACTVHCWNTSSTLHRLFSPLSGSAGTAIAQMEYSVLHLAWGLPKHHPDSKRAPQLSQSLLSCCLFLDNSRSRILCWSERHSSSDFREFIIELLINLFKKNQGWQF